MFGESQFYTPYEQDVPYGQAHNMQDTMQQQMPGQNGQQQQPYGMGNENMPQPMGFMPSSQQGYPSMGTQFSNNSMNSQNLAKGGHVSLRNLRKAINQLQSQGQGRDKILAHINPEEAALLSLTNGGDINPMTGLPQFGADERYIKELEDAENYMNFMGSGSREMPANFMNMHRQTFNQPYTKFHRFFDENIQPASAFLGRTLAIAAGNMLGGPLGGMAAGAASGAALEGNNERPNYGRGALHGGLHGAIQSYGGPMLGKAAGVGAGSNLGTMLGMGGGKFSSLGSLGAGAAKSTLGSAGRANAFSSLASAGQGVGAPQAAGGGGGFLGGLSNLLGGGSSAGGGGLFGGGLLSNALLATAIFGNMNAKMEDVPRQSLQDAINQGPQWGPQHQPRNIRPTERALIPFDPNNYRPGFNPEQLYFQNVNAPANYAEGGHVFTGNQGGQADNIKTNLPAGDYIIDASSTSDAGDGNSEAGSLKILHGLAALTKGKKYKSGGSPQGFVPANVSAGETRIDRDLVTAVGKGNNNKGASMIEKMVNNMRKHKRGSAKGLPPKAKSIQAYMGGK